MPAMAGDWPRDPRVYGPPQRTGPPAPVRTLPSVAELLSSRPSATTYHRHDYCHPQSTPPALTLAPATATPTPTCYPHSLHPRQTSPPVSPTERRPLPSLAVSYLDSSQLHPTQLQNKDPLPQLSTLASAPHNASHSTTQPRQDSAISHHRFDAANDAQSSKPTLSYSHQSPKDTQRQPTPDPPSYHPTASISAYGTAPARHHFNSSSSAAPYPAVSPTSHEHSTEPTIPMDTRTSLGSASLPEQSNTHQTTSASLPEHSNTHQTTNGTRHQRYNVRFAANYTSENMPPLPKPRNDPPTPNAAPAVVASPDQPRSSPAPITTTEEPSAPATNGTAHHVEPPSRSTRDTRDTRDRGDFEPSVERCSGCNEAWRRPIPDLDSRHISPAETNEEFRQIASNMIDRLRKQNKLADAAYDEWKWRHSHCNYRPASPYSIGSVDETSRRSEPDFHVEESTTAKTDRKRKSEIPHEPPHSASKQQRVTGTSPALPVRQPDSP